MPSRGEAEGKAARNGLCLTLAALIHLLRHQGLAKLDCASGNPHSSAVTPGTWKDGCSFDRKGALARNQGLLTSLLPSCDLPWISHPCRQRFRNFQHTLKVTSAVYTSQQANFWYQCISFIRPFASYGYNAQTSSSCTIILLIKYLGDRWKIVLPAEEDKIHSSWQFSAMKTPKNECAISCGNKSQILSHKSSVLRIFSRELTCLSEF